MKGVHAVGKMQPIDLPDVGVATNLQFVNDTIPVKDGKAKCSKTRRACVEGLLCAILCSLMFRIITQTSY